HVEGAVSCFLMKPDERADACGIDEGNVAQIDHDRTRLIGEVCECALCKRWTREHVEHTADLGESSRRFVGAIQNDFNGLVNHANDRSVNGKIPPEVNTSRSK